MPAPTHRRLTKEDEPRIIAYHTQQYSAADIAKEIGCSVRQVQRALHQLGLQAHPHASTALISWEQYQVTRWYANGTFSSRYLAERLGGVSWIDLDQELRGVRGMSKRRLIALLHLIKELDPQTNLPAKPPA